MSKFIYCGWNPLPECERVVIDDAPRFMRGLKIAFATDMHIRPTTSDEYIARIAHMLGTSGADMLLLGGDYGETRDAAVRFFEALREHEFPMGIFGVIGNNDVEAFEDSGDISDVFPGSLLVNDMVGMPLRGGRLMIGGLDELGYGSYPAKSLFPCVNNSYTITLAHYPKLHSAVSGARTRLMLSGHTHGGQFRMLGLDPYSIGYEHGYIDAVRGMKTIGPTKLLISNGIGVSKLPLRIGCVPQIHIIEFD